MIAAVKSFKIYTVVMMTLLLWASAFVGIRIGLVSYSPGALGLLRFLIASLCMMAIYPYLPAKQPMSMAVKLQLMLLGMAAIGIYTICLNYGEVTVSAGVASFVIGLVPALTVMTSVLFLQEQVNWKVWAGILISMLGLLLIAAGEKSHSALSGVLIILISSIMSVIYNLSQKRYLRNFHPIAITAWMIWGGTLMLVFFSADLVHQLPHASWPATAAAIYMGIFPGAIAYAGWCYVLDHWVPSRASLFFYTLPILSTAMGFIALHEKPSTLSLGGGCLALVGALIASRCQTRVLTPELQVVEEGPGRNTNKPSCCH